MIWLYGFEYDFCKTYSNIEYFDAFKALHHVNFLEKLNIYQLPNTFPNSTKSACKVVVVTLEVCCLFRDVGLRSFAKLINILSMDAGLLVHKHLQHDLFLSRVGLV